MTTFEDGPAKGQTLMLQRAPLFLRVVVDPSGKVDALDQLTDTPASNEKIFAYVLTAEPGRFHIYKRARGSGWYAIGSYKQVFPQPTESVMRNNASWRDWTYLQPIPAALVEFVRAREAA